MNMADANGWMPIETAPKSTSTPTKLGHHVVGRFILGFIPEPEMSADDRCHMAVIWWEPHQLGQDRGAWISDSCCEVKPTHWRELPESGPVRST
jgi:hypothetical protein